MQIRNELEYFAKAMSSPQRPLVTIFGGSKVSTKIQLLENLLDKVDVIECFEQPGLKLRVGEILEKQKQIYADLGVEPPTSLWVAGNSGS